MNQDLDDRLIPNGEYRDAQNISVGKSEADDIGALENVLGNSIVPGTDLGIANLEIIGHLEDDNNNIIYLFLTDNNTNHFIYKYDISLNPSYVKLLEGIFLNFNTEFPITGVNLVENLLFWTDNRNQPRKINVEKSKDIRRHFLKISPHHIEAMKMLATKLYEIEYAKHIEAISSRRKTLVSTGDRSAKVRTYNYPQGRVTDHRIGLTLYNLSAIVNGDIQEILNALQVAENAERLKETQS